MVKNTGEMHKGHRQRLKNRVLKNGLESMEPHEILEWILTYTIPYKDVNPLAHVLLSHFGSLSGVLDAGYHQLSKMNGVGHETALFLSTLPEMFNQYSASRTLGRVVLTNINKCIDYFRNVNMIKHQEEFFVFCLDSKFKLLKLVKVADGNASSVSFETATLTSKIACQGVKRAVLLHIHPNGDISPSLADFVATKKILSVCYMLGIRVEDHIIINDTDYYSFVKSGAFYKLVEEVADSLKNVIGITSSEYIKKYVGFSSN